MLLRIVHIDFDKGNLLTEFDPQHAGGMLQDMEFFLRDCASYDLTDVGIVCRPGMTNLQRAVLGEIASRHGARLLPGCTAPAEPQVADSRNCLQCEATELVPDIPVEYSLNFCDMEKTLKRLNAAMALIAAASGLGDVDRNQLRLTVYELAVNAIEHGDFAVGQAEIRLNVRVAPEIITVSYRDNSSLFVTNDPDFVDLQNKIEKGDRRGLGLFMLNKMARSLEYRRLGDWNLTEISLQTEFRTPHNLRRTFMEGITVEISPGGTDDTKIVRPAGTIDSSTTTTLESHINKLIALGTRIIVIDFAKVEFVSSAGIGVFLGTVSQLRADGGDLIFMKMPKHIEAVFNIINLQSYFVTINDISDLSTTGSARK